MESMKTFVKDCQDPALFLAAKGWRSPEGDSVSPGLWFANRAKEAGVAPSDAQLDRHAAYWEAALGCRPWEVQRKRHIREFAAKNWAVEQVMRECGYPVRGEESPTVDTVLGTKTSFVHTTAQSVFPFQYLSMIEAGMLAEPLMGELVSEMVQCNGNNATHAEMAEVDWERGTGQTAEGTIAKSVTVRFRERNIVLKEFRSRAEVTRKAAKSMRLPVFSRAIQRVGQQFQILLTDFAMSVLIDGDGTSPSNVVTDVAAGVASTPVYSDVLGLQFNFTMGYQPNMLIGNATTLPKILNMAEFKDSRAGFDYQATGNLVNPVGMNLRRWDATGNVTTWTSSNVLMLDTRLALTGYQWGQIETNAETILESNWERLYTEATIGFGIWDPAARRRGTNW